MIAILNSREEAKSLSSQIQAWNKANISGYSATSWANEILPDTDYDAPQWKLYRITGSRLKRKIITKGDCGRWKN
jgi:hypothetical protein